MIIANSHKKIKSFIYSSQASIDKFYNDIVCSIDFCSIPCPFCGKCHWAFHASYPRKLLVGHHILSFDIQRIICNECHHTHAILLDCMIPYAILSADHIIEVSINDDLPVTHHKPLSHDYFSLYLFFCVLSKRNHPCVLLSPHQFFLFSFYNDLVFQLKGGHCL